MCTCVEKGEKGLVYYLSLAVVCGVCHELWLQRLQSWLQRLQSFLLWLQRLQSFLA